MHTISRRKLARYIADQLNAGESIADLSKQAAAVLIANKKTAQLEQFIDDVLWELENSGHLAVANVTSAHALDERLKKDVSELIKQKTKVSKVEINETVDSSLLGGIRVETSTFKLDKSLKSALNQLREAI